MENTLKTPDTMTKPLRPTTKQAAWEEFLETMLVYASGRVQDGPLAEIIANGLNAFSYLPGYRSATLYFMDKDTYEFRHSTSIPESAQNWAQQLFSRLVDQGDIAWALDSGHAFVSPKQDDPQRPAHLMILTLSVPTTVIGLMLIFLDEPPELMEHMIRGLCLLHAKTFAYMLNNVTMIGELRGQQSILEQRVAARTQSLEQAKRALEITTQRIKEAKEVAERASEFKSAFLANMSHEIRTPLNGVLGMLALTLESDLNPMQRDFLQTAQKSAQSLLALINNILDLAKIEAGRFEKHDVKFNLCDLLATVADTTAHGAHQKGIELICAADEDVPVLLVGDDGWLRQILVNLAGNAIKFTEKGEVILRIERLNTDQTRARVRFSVTDSGIGISKKNQARVFESFTQADGSVTRKYGGTGLGLTISRQLCQRMGGQMQLESEEGKGSRFWFDVELDQQTGLPPALPRLPEGHRILIIDDNQAAAQTLARILQAWGGAAQIASEAGEGIRIAGQAEAQGAPFHSIFCDLTLAGPGALPEAAAPLLPNLLREATAASGARIIGMAQPGRPHYDWGALDKLCDLMLNKPLKRDHLLIALGLAPMEGAAKILAETRAPETVRAGARILLVEDVEINRKVVKGMLKDSGCEIETAENGCEALAALEKKRFDLVLMDIQMPEMDGLTAASLIRKQLLLSDLPIIALSAHAFAEEREKSLAAGMNDHLSKPVEKAALLACLNRWLSAGAANVGTPKEPAPAVGGAPGAAPESPSPAEEGPAVDVKEALERVGNDKELLIELFGMLEENLNEILPKLEAAIERSSAEEARSLSHRLKGSAANLSALALRQSASQIEQLAKQSDWAGIRSAMPGLHAESERFKAFRKTYS